MRAAWEARRDRLPRDHGHLAMMDASMAYLRQFVPDVLAAVRFAGGPGTDDLLQAVTILAGLYATRARKVPDGAPGGFVPARWAGYLEKAAKDGDVTAYRHYWELCVLMALRDGLRSGDVYVPGSRRYADPASFLLTPQQWEPQRLEFCHLAGKPASAADTLALANDELHAALSDLEAQLARGGGAGEVRLGADGELVIPPLTAEDVPAEAEALRAELGALLPRVPIASVLVEVGAPGGTSTTRCWRTSGPPIARTSTSTAPTRSMSTASSPSSTPTATGRCAPPPPQRPHERGQAEDPPAPGLAGPRRWTAIARQRAETGRLAGP
jgi:hypothetical protein